MGEGYHKPVCACLQQIVIREKEQLDPQTMFEKQTYAMDTILQPLHSSAASGFRRSQGVNSVNAASKNLLARVQANPKRPSWFPVSESAPVPEENRFSRTHRPDGSMINSWVNKVWNCKMLSCHLCRSFYPSQKGLESQKTKNSEFCQDCRLCLPSESLAEHYKLHHPNNARWSSAPASAGYHKLDKYRWSAN